MIGNNSCGAHAMAYGTTAANVVSLDVIDGAGRYLHAGTGGQGSTGTGFGSTGFSGTGFSGTGDGSTVPGLDSFIADRLMPISQEFGRFRRQVSGYSLEHLLPERGGSLARALTGTEGTCGIILGATVSLVPLPATTALCVLGYPDMPAAADDAPGLAVLAGPTGQTPLALEGIDARMVNVVRAHRSRGTVPPLPAGDAWLFAEVGGSSEAEAMAAARSLVASAAAVDSMIVPAGPEAALLWRIREDGSGLGSRTAAGAPAWPAWEDAAVPPARLGPYLREFLALLDSHQLDGLIYGHFGDGCLHVRIDLPLADHPERLRPFLVDAAELVARYGGSLSGEHGDGRARGELLPIMYSRAAIDAFAAFKGLFDPDGLLNPGIIVDPRPADADLRLPEARPLRTPRRVRAHGRRREPDPGRAPVYRDGQMPGGQRARRRVHVPVVPRHQGREGLHPGPGPGAPGDVERVADPGRMAFCPRSTTRSTCACPARRAPVTARCRWTWPPTRPTSFTRPTGAGYAPAATTCWAGSRAGPGWPRRLPAWPAPRCG